MTTRESVLIGVAIGVVTTPVLAWTVVYVFRNRIHERAARITAQRLREYLASETLGIASTANLPTLQAMTDRAGDAAATAALETIWINV